jgi:DNA-binding NtrC family response regulator
MAKSAKLKILYGEGDAEILASQAAHIEKAGHSVQPAAGRKAVEQALSKGPFDLVVLGPTLTRNDRHHLPYMVKKASQQTSVLVMHADGSRHPYVDACTDTGASLETVLTKIENMKLANSKLEVSKPAAAAAAAGR